MDRRTLRVGVVAALCIVALAAAAATLNTAQPTGGGVGPGADEDAGIAPGESDGEGFGGETDRGGSELFDRGAAWGGCYPFLTSLEFLLGAAAVVLAIWGVVTWRRNAAIASASLLAFGLPVFVVYLFLAVCPEGATQREEMGLATNNSSVPSGGGMPGLETGTNTTPPSLVVLALLGVVLLVAAAVVVRATGDDEVELHRPEEPADDEDEVETIGRVAGEAADRIDASGAVENEVYRAWRRMVGLLDVEHPDATTPGEFADAAAAAGMDRADVDELTDLFEAVRYGGAAPSEGREQRAVEALRRIEDKYGSGGR